MANLGTMKAKVVLETVKLDNIRIELRILDDEKMEMLNIMGSLRLLPYLLWALQTGDGETVKKYQEEYKKCETKS